MKKFLYGIFCVVISGMIWCDLAYSGTKRGENLKSEMVREYSKRYNNMLKKLRIDKKILDRFIKVYPKYITLVNSCSEDANRADQKQVRQMTQECLKKMKDILKKYGFDNDTFSAIMARITTAYAIASMEDSPLAGNIFLKAMQKSLRDSGQSELTKKEIALVKKYLPELDAVLNQN